MHQNGGLENYRFEFVAQFACDTYPDGGAARLASEMVGSLIRELGAGVGCLNCQIPGRSSKECYREHYYNDPVYRETCIPRFSPIDPQSESMCMSNHHPTAVQECIRTNNYQDVADDLLLGPPHYNRVEKLTVQHYRRSGGTWIQHKLSTG
jgi:hypothetical protein